MITDTDRARPALDTDVVTRAAVVPALSALAVIHVVDLPGSLGPDRLVGIGYLGIIAAAILASGAMIARSHWLAWSGAGGLASAAMTGYLLTRALPGGFLGDHGDVGNWRCPLGIAALSVETLIILLTAAWIWMARTRTTSAADKDLSARSSVRYGWTHAQPSPVPGASSGYSEHTQWLIDREMAALLTRTETRAQELLTRHMDALHRLTAALMDRETTSGDQVRALVQDADPTPLLSEPLCLANPRITTNRDGRQATNQEPTMRKPKIVITRVGVALAAAGDITAAVAGNVPTGTSGGGYGGY